MQSTSALYKELLNGQHWKETKLQVNDVEYREDVLRSLTTDHQVFREEKPAVGGALSGELDAKLRLPSSRIPRMAELHPFVRLTDGTRTSEWIPKGVYWVDTRESDASNTVVTLHGYDAMMRAEDDYPDSALEWPATDIAVVREIAGAMGVEIDERTFALMTQGYLVQLPSGYSMREVLGYIAAMYGGNFILSDQGKLLLLPLNALPEESYYLVNMAGDFITFGGYRIRVR